MTLLLLEELISIIYSLDKSNVLCIYITRNTIDILPIDITQNTIYITQNTIDIFPSGHGPKDAYSHDKSLGETIMLGSVG